ncbi:MAG: indole-3-glycerol phosphate synthase TrpC [Chloroflexi bacterium]|nr:indole-3-glycerol phosphate synthase TrpC [Chloroflexota bacterium]MCY3582339.1 indole-3-glycerol phosphate synthase TrpC [Chloroflexota bacterium]MCY3717499.1 indole-3-glycerol phosphate synthase TrpC [Chloroflexota bacterium]MDE2652015.1 indole-3-glycerol phosphate synthase TrpC [Chloroflexota bacterium]MXV94047.1 indole-3-glycerol phosphate synthase TrpC [Chloroflexota bacterium]
MSFVSTNTILDRILARKLEEVAERRGQVSLSQLRARAEASQYPPRDFLAGLRGDCIALIAEVKRASPSKGLLTRDFAPVLLAGAYANNGAAAVSVLTDEDFFRGSLHYLTAIRQAVALPILRKDFIIDAYQVYAGRAAGSDAILLIVAALGDAQLRDLHELIQSLGMVALVEVHNEREMERALRLGATLIGINNRDLKTFHVDLTTTARLAEQVGDAALLVAESGIFTRGHVREMAAAGADAILVGESLIRAPDLASLTRELSAVERLAP